MVLDESERRQFLIAFEGEGASCSSKARSQWRDLGGRGSSEGHQVADGLDGNNQGVQWWVLALVVGTAICEDPDIFELVAARKELLVPPLDLQ
jgi:hypothetical protein